MAEKGKAGKVKSKAVLQTIDIETGEQLSGTVVLIPQKRKNEFHEGWVAMSQPAMQLFSQIRSLETQRVLWSLLARLDYENYVLVNQSEIADSLAMKKPNFSRAMKNLVDLAVLLPGPKVGTCKTYRLNPSHGWKGTTTNHSKALDERLKAKGMSVIEGGRKD